MPWALASARNASGRRPTRIGSGMTRVPLPSATPPCARIAAMERARCWFAPIRPVTPCMMMPSRCSAMASLLSSRRARCVVHSLLTRLDELDRDPVRTASVDAAPTLVRPLIASHRQQDRLAAVRLHCITGPVDVVDVERNVREPGVAPPGHHPSFLRPCPVLDQLDHVAG